MKTQRKRKPLTEIQKQQARERMLRFRAKPLTEEQKQRKHAHYQKWAQSNPEKRRELDRRFRKANRERLLEVRRLRYQKPTPEQQREKGQRYRQKPESRPVRRNNHYRNRYGINSEVRRAMFEAQQGRCYICDVRESELQKLLEVDHEHVTRGQNGRWIGPVRSLLCHTCNIAVGMVEARPWLYGTDNEFVKYLDLFGRRWWESILPSPSRALPTEPDDLAGSLVPSSCRTRECL